MWARVRKGEKSRVTYREYLYSTALTNALMPYSGLGLLCCSIAEAAIDKINIVMVFLIAAMIRDFGVVWQPCRCRCRCRFCLVGKVQ